jgi:hypothetical protein
MSEDETEPLEGMYWQFAFDVERWHRAVTTLEMAGPSGLLS